MTHLSPAATLLSFLQVAFSTRRYVMYCSRRLWLSPTDPVPRTGPGPEQGLSLPCCCTPPTKECPERAQVRAQGVRAGTRTHSFCGLGAAGIQAVGWARQREVAGFGTGPATVLGPGGALLLAGRAAVCAAALGLCDGTGQDLGQVVGGSGGDTTHRDRSGD